MRILKTVDGWCASGNTFEEDDLIEYLFDILKMAGFYVRMNYVGDYCITSNLLRDKAYLDMLFAALKKQSATPYYS